MKKNFFLIFRFAATLALFYVLFKFIPYGQLISVYKDSKKIYLFAGFFAFILSYFVAVLRWKFLLSSLGVKVSFLEACYAFASGQFFNLFFPSVLAGDLFRGIAISYRYRDTKKAVSSVLMDRFSGAVALNLIALISFIAARGILRQKEVLLALSILSGIILFLFLVIFSKRFFNTLARIFKEGSLFKKKIVNFHDQLYFFKKNPLIFIKSLFFSVAVQGLFPIGFFIASKAFSLELSYVYFFILVPIIMAITLIPITIAGAGTREASAVYFFSLVGVAKSVGFGIFVLDLVFRLFIGIVGGVFYVGICHRWLQCDPQNKPAAQFK